MDQGASGGYKAVVKDVQGKPAPFDGEAVGKKAGKESGVSVDAESDVSLGWARVDRRYWVSGY